MEVTLCIICGLALDLGSPNVVTLREKGSMGINKASEMRNDSIHTLPGQKVHKECRRNYCHHTGHADSNAKNFPDSDINTHALRSCTQGFNFETDCLFCGKLTMVGGKRKQHDSFNVKTLTFKDSILDKCNERCDKWSDTVKARLLCVHDLLAPGAVYHQSCSVNFRTNKDIPAMHQVHESDTTMQKQKKKRHGRLPAEEQLDAFFKVIQFLKDNDDEQITVNDLIAKMQSYLVDSELEAYSRKYMKAKLMEHFGTKLIITEINGKANVVTFKRTADAVLHEFNASQKLDPEVEKKNIIKTSAQLIRDDIKSVATSGTTYPAYNEMESLEACLNFLPDSLRLFLEEIFAGKDNQLKLASIGQAIMQATRPRVLLAPLQIGLGVQLHHHYGSRFLLDTLHQHGFCCSYQESQQFEKNAALELGTDIPDCNPSKFIQYSADNVDHDIRTIDGKGTFHGMGIIATVTPSSKTCHSIPRRKVSPEDIVKAGQIPIHYYKEDYSCMTKLKYQSLTILTAHDPTAKLDILWKTSILFNKPRPAWSGMMQFVHHGVHPGKSSVLFLPMIDMNSSDATCIYSTLKFVANHAYQHAVTPVITFDQPLWWKALMIIASEPTDSLLHKMVLRLGGFHTQMSFLGSIGHLMAGSGLHELMELTYAPNAVDHIMSGKAVARAVRAHLLIDAALNALFVANTFGIKLPCQEYEIKTGKSSNNSTTLESKAHNEDHAAISPTSNGDLSDAAVLYETLMSGVVSAEQASEDQVLCRIQKSLEEKRKSMESLRTSQLWFQYMHMIDIIRTFVKAERTGNWELHLQSVSDMLPYLAASGHNLYAKSARIYLQNMMTLAVEHPQVYNHFKNGCHVVRRSDRMWAGLSTDLIIEQVLMRSLKTSGGLTRGRGMEEQQRLTWLMSMPACGKVNHAMQELTGIAFNSGEQNKDLALSRQTRDMKDTMTLLQFLEKRDPFTSDPGLQNIASGVFADCTVNVDNALSIGRAILESMNGKTVNEYSLKKKEQAITLATKLSVKIEGDSVQVDPQLLFQWLIFAAKNSSDMADIFQFELCSYPPALFDSSLMLRQPQKSKLADAIYATLSTGDIQGPNGRVQYVLDGGALLHRIPWSNGPTTYQDIYNRYSEYVVRHYGNAIVVFDGYTMASTKDSTHQRRTGGTNSTTVKFSSDMVITMKKHEFLANKTNKQRFINGLSEHLETHNCKIYHAKDDADVLIVQKAVDSATEMNTVLIGDDTDLLILLCYHARLEGHDLFFQSEQKSNSNKCRIWNIKKVKQKLGLDICSNILFVHAILGCDTTSRLHGIGKGVALKKCVLPHFIEQAQIFQSPTSSRDEIISAGEKALVCLYNGQIGENLNVFRYKRFCEKIATSTSHIQPQNLPPTSGAAKYHSLRTYYQVQQWADSDRCKSPEYWGWKSIEEKFVPLMTDSQPAPEELLKVIRCNCQNDCSTLRCTCRKHHLECSAACGHCRGYGCNNSPQFADEDKEFDDADSL